MIENITLLWVGTVALACTFGGLRIAVPSYQAGEGSLTGLVAFAFGLVFWILFAIHSTGYLQGFDGAVQTQSTLSLLVVGLIGALLSLLLLFDAATRTMGDKL